MTVTNLYDVTFEEAMQAILGTHKYEVKGNFIKVYTNEEYMADEDRFENYMFTLYYINAEEAEKLAKALLSEFGTIAATTAVEGDMEAGKGGDTLAVHDRLVVRDYPEVIESIRGMLSEVDVEPMQVLLEVTILKAQLTEATEFGIDWSNVPGVELSNRGVDWQDGQLQVGISIDNITGCLEN